MSEEEKSQKSHIVTFRGAEELALLEELVKAAAADGRTVNQYIVRVLMAYETPIHEYKPNHK